MGQTVGVDWRREGLNWSELIPANQWELFERAIERIVERDVSFAIGGGFAFSAYSQRWRNTKDIDLFVLPEDRDVAIDAVRHAGFADYFEQLPYDRNWIFRGYQSGVIVDIIWQMANYRAQVDRDWLTRGREVEVHGRRLRLLPPEELIWCKLYVMQRERFDWPDLLNIVFVQGPSLDWQRLLDRVGEDLPLLTGLLSVLGWMCPSRARELPLWIWSRLGLTEPQESLDCSEDRRRVRLLDSRDWFGPKSGGM